MVSNTRGADDERGQLILIGAIAIALIVIGLVLVVNTALFTEVVGSEGTVETAKESGVAGQELGDSASVVVRTNNSLEGDTTESDVRPIIDGQMNDRLRNGSLDGRGAFVNITYSGTTEPGTSILQPTNGSMGNSSGTWEPVPNVDPADVGQFLLVVDVSSSSGPMQIDVQGASDDESLTIEKNGGDIEVVASTGSSCTVSPTDGTVRIDVYRGVVYEDGCQFDLFQGLDPGYGVEITDGDQIEGQYYIVTERDGILSLLPCSDSEIDCYDAIWSYDLQYTYDTDEVTAASERREVNVYD